MPHTATLELDLRSDALVVEDRFCPCCHARGEGCSDEICHGLDAD